MSKFDEIKSPWYQKHLSVIQKHLKGETIEEDFLWFAVGYFWNGSGWKFRQNLKLTREQWASLLEDTNRDPEEANDKLIIV